MANVTHECVLLGDGSAVDYTPSAAQAAGEVNILNGMFRFATQPIPISTLGSVKAVAGPPAVRIVKVVGNLGVGDVVYWDANGTVVGATTASTGAATRAAVGNTLIGRVMKAAGVSAQTVDVQLTLGVVTESTLQNVIADPGTGNAIPVTASGHVPIAMGGVGQTNTLAAPTFPGQELLIYAVSEAGGTDTRIITCATLLNIANNNTITFEDVGEAVHLVAVEEGAATYRWRVVFQDPSGTVHSV